MIKVEVQNTKNSRSFGATFETQAEANAWILKQEALKSWGVPERMVVDKAYEGEVPPNAAIEDYLIEDVLETILVDMGLPYGEIPYVRLKSDYVIDAQDISETYDYKLEQCYKARKEAYGSLDDQLDEIYHDFDAWKARIAQVKLDNPKPTV